MPHPSEDDGEANIVVILHKLLLNKASNYFATLKVDFPPQDNPDHHDSDDSVTHRTEVQKSTKQPVFKTRAFCFKLPPTSSNAFSELRLYSPCLYVQLFEVLRKDERGIAKPYGSATLAFSREQIDALVSRKTLALTLYLVSNTNGANVGQCEAEIFMSDTASPPPASPPSPSPPVIVSQPRTTTVYESHNSLQLGNLDEAEHLTFTITVHCGVNLGSQNLPPPSPFVTAKTTRDAAAKRPAKTATMMSKNQRNVLWNEKLNVSMSRKDMAEGQGIFLAVIDFDTKRYIGKCILPVKGITIGYQYHMRLLTHEDGYLLVSLSVEDKTDPEVNRFLKDSDLYHVQLSLKRLLEPVQPQHSNMIAVVNLIDDGQAYKQNYIADNVPKIPFNTLLMAEAHDKFGSVIKHWSRVWQFCGPPNLNQLFEFTLEKRQRQTNYCITVEFFYLDFSLVAGSVTPISPMSPMSPVTPQTSIPHFPTGNSSKDSAGIVFWGSAVIPLFEFIKAPARTVTINEIEIPVYRSPHVVNYLELDIKRRDAHDYMKDIAPAKEKEKTAQLKVRQPAHVTARTPSPSPLSPQIIRSSVSPPSRLSSPTPKPHAPRHIGEESSSLIFNNHHHRESTNYNSNLQNGLLSAAVTNKMQDPNGSGSPSHDTPHSPHFPVAKRGSIPRQTFRDLTIIPPTTPGPNATRDQNNASPTQAQPKPDRYANNAQSSTSFVPIHKPSPSTSPVPPEESGNNYNNKRYNEFDNNTMTSDITSINDHYDTHNMNVNNNNNNNNNGAMGGFGANDLRRLLEQQQMILDQLMKDREGTNNTLKKVESDLSDLRSQNQVLQRENTMLRQESVKKIDTGSYEVKIVELTEAQQKMSAIIENLQTENTKQLETNLKQEKVIQKLESLLTFSITEMKKASKLQFDYQNANDNKKKTDGMQGVISKPRLAATIDLSASGGNTTNFTEKAEVDARIKRVESEMAKNAEALAAELNSLRSRLQRSKFPSDTNLPKVPSSHSITSTPSTSFTSHASLSSSPSSSTSLRKNQSLSANSSPSSSINGHPLSASLSSSPSDLSPPLSLNGNFDKSSWDLYSSKSNLSTSRIKARKNLPVKHKETGEYRRPHMLMPMSPPPPSS